MFDIWTSAVWTKKELNFVSGLNRLNLRKNSDKTNRFYSRVENLLIIETKKNLRWFDVTENSF